MLYAVYLDNTVISAVARPRKRATDAASIRFWQHIQARTHMFKPVISEYVTAEAGRGKIRDSVDARLELCRTIVSLGASSAYEVLANRIKRHMGWSPKMMTDALHLAAATLNHIDLLVSSDRHLTSTNNVVRLGSFLGSERLYCPILVTPEVFVDDFSRTERSNPRSWKPRRRLNWSKDPYTLEVERRRADLGSRAAGSWARLRKLYRADLKSAYQRMDELGLGRPRAIRIRKPLS